MQSFQWGMVQILIMQYMVHYSNDIIQNGYRYIKEFQELIHAMPVPILEGIQGDYISNLHYRGNCRANTVKYPTAATMFRTINSLRPDDTYIHQKTGYPFVETVRCH